MSSHKCPFCGHTSPLISSTFRTFEISFDGSHSVYKTSPHLAIKIFRCANAKCGKDSIEAKGLYGYIEERRVKIYPNSSALQFPEYIPEAIRADYEEACAICFQSPKAAATLARRCLQGMIRDFWDIKYNRLFDEIKALKGKVPPAQWKAIDALREIGNIGAHMEEDVNRIIDVDPGEAEKLIALIELLLKSWYVSRHDEEELYREISAAAKEKKSAKKAQSSNEP